VKGSSLPNGRYGGAFSPIPPDIVQVVLLMEEMTVAMEINSPRDPRTIFGSD
jgi:hypothetical protein